MAADNIHHAQRFFQVDRAGGVESNSARQGFRRHINHETVALGADNRQADAVMGNRVAECDIAKVQSAAIDIQAVAHFARGEMCNAAYGCDDSGKHGEVR